jgi:hypothetical protein
MDAKVIEATIQFMFGEMRSRLDQAASIAKAAEVCADGGNVEKAVEIVLDVEQLTYESANLLNAASTLNRISREHCTIDNCKLCFTAVTPENIENLVDIVDG